MQLRTGCNFAIRRWHGAGRAFLCVSIAALLPRVVAAEEPPRFDFTRLLAHWAEYDHPDYLPFVFEAEPDVVQLGFYGAHFWSLVHTDAYNGYPAHFPVKGLKPCGDWFQERNKQLHDHRIKVVGHFNVEFLVGDLDGPNGPTGFFRFYRDLWDETELGPRPVADPATMLERGPDGMPIGQAGYGIGGMHEYWACLRNPHWQAVLRAWVRRGIERGVDGFIANYFYRHNCVCDHCTGEFRRYLSDRYTTEELRTKFQIDAIDRHQFSELGYWHDPKQSSPLKLEMLRWSQISNKQVFDKIFVEYGRSLKPDLIVGQWNHIGDFNQIDGDERCLLPADLWGKNETYLWYSTGGAACATDLARGNLGEGTLQARYIRGMFGDKPYTLGKYEQTRIRATIAELAANGGAPMGFYSRFTDAESRRELVRYYQFIKQYDEIFRGNRSHAEAVLVYPRRAVAAGDVASVERFRRLGKQLLDSHRLFDVCSDEPQHDQRRARYSTHYFPDMGVPVEDDSQFSRFDAPPTVRISATEPAAGNELDLHFVNYNRTEPPRNSDGSPSPGTGIKDEQPIEAPPIACDVRLPTGVRVATIELITPESPRPQLLDFSAANDRVRFATPKFLVYSVCRLKLAKQ